MKKYLVIYYSRTGTSEKVAEKLRSRLECDMERITDKINRKGAAGYIRAGKEVLGNQINKLIDVKYDPSQYQHVIFVTPIWAAKACTPIASYWSEFKKKIGHYSIITVSGGSDGEKVVREAEELLGKQPISTQFIYKRSVKKDEYELESFRII